MKNNIDDVLVDQILKTTKTIALIGASIKKERPSNSVMRNLLKRGYQVFPVNPGHAGNEILGQKCYSKLSEIKHEIDMVDVFRQSNAVPEIVEHAIKSAVKRVAGLRYTLDGVPTSSILPAFITIIRSAIAIASS